MYTRLATPADAAAVAELYSKGIASRVATFETKLRTEEDIAAWFRTPYPVVMVEDEGEVSAFAATSSYRPRACYPGIAEFMVYIALDKQQRGLGRAALEALFPVANERGLYKLVSRVFVDNYASRRLLAKVGFREVGVYERHGMLGGVWRDVVIVERLSDESEQRVRSCTKRTAPLGRGLRDAVGDKTKSGPLLSSPLLSLVWALSASRNVHQSPERVRVLRGEVGQNFAVDLDARFAEAAHEDRVTQPLLAGRGVDTRDPQAAKIVLFVAAVTVLVIGGVEERLLRDTEAFGAHSPKAFGAF